MTSLGLFDMPLSSVPFICLGSGALPGKVLLVGIVVNYNIDAYLRYRLALLRSVRKRIRIESRMVRAHRRDYTNK